MRDGRHLVRERDKDRERVGEREGAYKKAHVIIEISWATEMAAGYGATELMENRRQKGAGKIH